MLAAGGGWLLNRPTGALAPTTGAPAASAPRIQEPPLTEAAAAPTSAAAPVGRPSLPMPTAPPADEMRKVQLALEGSASPKDALDAAKILLGCRGVELAVESMYRMRDQANPEWQQLDKTPGFRTDEVIARQQDFQRRCQVFDAATLARMGELFKRTYEGGAKDSALPYLQWLNGDGKQEANPELLAKLQRETRQTAEDGDFMALTAYSHEFNLAPLGANPVQRQAFKEAWFRIQGEMSGAEMEKSSRASMENLEKMMSQRGGALPALSAEQQREADALSERVVDAWRKRQGKGGRRRGRAPARIPRAAIPSARITKVIHARKQWDGRPT